MKQIIPFIVSPAIIFSSCSNAETKADPSNTAIDIKDYTAINIESAGGIKVVKVPNTSQ
ncbi:MAG: hypothetical protein LH619_00145 [Chitinophagaceae bacterium]|nr:hypothetical protein [Chitinophagaceae bacterium]